MEVIRLPGYTEDEKVEHRHAATCCRSRSRTTACKDGRARASSDAAIRDIIRYYTREAGVRNLEREIAKICRKVGQGTAARAGDRQGDRGHAEEPGEVPRRAPLPLRPAPRSRTRSAR
ncbi:MAG: hypothetical protein MZV65_17430 [Chromatiales bacterium]|nr:hypothetical protein [Chromatiales bacterium]